jgi:hypothetical protein
VRTFSVNRDVAGMALGAATTDLRQFQALVEASSDLIGMADSEGHVLYLNPGGRRLLRMPADRDVASLTVSEVVPGAGDTAFAGQYFRRYVYGHQRHDWQTLLAPAGLVVRPANPDKPWLGLSGYEMSGKGATLLAGTQLNTPLYEAGLDRGDVIEQVREEQLAAHGVEGREQIVGHVDVDGPPLE